MIRTVVKVMIGLSVLMVFGLAGCGGGAESGGGSSMVSGVAAAGAPIVGTVYLKDSASTASLLSSSIKADGSYSFDVTGLKPPFILKAQGSVGSTNYVLYSFLPSVGVANINPLTHLSVVQANGGADPANIYANPILKTSLISAALPNVLDDIRTKLDLILSYFGASRINWISDSFSANHLSLDQLFDLISITVSNGIVTISNKSNGNVIFSSALGSGLLNGSININNIPNRYSISDSWKLKTSGTSNNLIDVTYGNGVFVAVGSSGTILTSVDGTTWQPSVSGVATDLYKVIYANGIFIAAGQSGKVITSTDGIVWQQRTSGVSSGIADIAFGHGIFVALASNTILTSANGVTWTVSATLPNWQVYNGITYGNGTFVVVTINSTEFTSTDGISWQPRVLTAGSAPNLQAVTYANGTFVTVGPSLIMTSADGASWQKRVSSLTLGPINGVVYSNGAFIAVGKLGLALISDANGVNWWKWSSSGTNEYLNSVTYGKGTVIAVGQNGTIIQLGP